MLGAIGMSTETCLGDDLVRGFLAGALDAAAIDAVEAHVDTCTACRRRLAAHASATEVASATPAGALRDALASAAADRADPPAVIDGQYRVTRVIGRGGMGVVYLARDLRLDRDVAVKLGHARSSSALQRVEREAVALARLQHPNVVAIHQVGQVDGRLYIAMEHVAGGTAREWRAAAPRSWRAVVALYAAAGDGLAAAHAAGLVHRDFKPDNVLVGADGRPRVADFGLVRGDGPISVDGEPAPAPTSPALAPMTQVGAVVGTLAYMAPEQLDGGDVDARADQFAFACALWEALFEVRPFGGRTPAELAASIGHGEPRRPEGRPGRRVPRHVVVALRRALAADRARRWPSMGPLVAALRRDPGRTRRLVVGAVAIAAATSAAVVVLRGGRDEARCDDGAAAIADVWSPARAARIASGLTAAGAGATWPGLRGRLDDFTRAWAGARDDACRATRIDGAQSEAILDRRTLCLDRARTAFDAIVAPLERGGRDAVGQVDRATALLPDLAACADIARLSAEPPLPADPARRARIAAVGDFLTRVEVHWGYRDSYQPRITAAIAVGAARAAGWSRLVAEALLLRGELLDEADDPGVGAAYRQAVDEALASGDDDDAAWALAGYAETRLTAGDPDGAGAWIAAARAESARLGAPAATAVRVLTADARVANDLGDAARALADAREMLDLERRSGDPLHVAISRGNVALADARAGQFVDAEREIMQALADAARVVGEAHPRIASLCGQAATIFTMSGRRAEAVAQARHAVAILEAWYGADDDRLVEALDKLGASLMYLSDRHDEARTILTRELALMRRTSAGPVAIAGEETNLAVLDAQDGHPADALAHGERALATLESVGGRDNPNLNAPLLLVGITSRMVGKLDQSRAYLARDVAILDHAGADLGDRLNAHLELSNTLLAQDAAADAVAALAPVADAIARGTAVRPGVLAEGGAALAHALWAAGDHRRARAAATTARAAYVALGAPAAGDVAQLDAWLRAHP
jgi:tetratricopeptide (TPR) repeat protein